MCNPLLTKNARGRKSESPTTTVNMKNLPIATLQRLGLQSLTQRSTTSSLVHQVKRTASSRCFATNHSSKEPKHSLPYVRLESSPNVRIPIGYDHSRDRIRRLSPAERNYLILMAIAVPAFAYFVFQYDPPGQRKQINEYMRKHKIGEFAEENSKQSQSQSSHSASSHH